MLDRELKQKIDTFILKDYFTTDQALYQLIEEEDTGRSQLDVSFPTTSNILCLPNYDNKHRCEFLSWPEKHGMRKCVDHVFLYKASSGKWVILLIEMKTSVGDNTWIDIKKKVRASILNIKALAAVLDLPIERFLVYTTYENLLFKNPSPENPVERKQHLGVPSTKEDEWDQERIKINLLNPSRDEFHHTGIQMNRQVIGGKSTLYGTLNIT